MSRVATRSALIAALLTLAVAAPAHAQIAHKYFGFTGGATYGNITNYNAINSDWRTGATAGIMLGVATTGREFFELAPAWTQMGGGGTGIDYVDIPFISGLVLPLGNPNTIFRPYLGATVSFKVSCTSEAEDVCDAAKGTFWALPLGMSLIKVLGEGRFFGVDVRYAPFPLYDAFDGSDARLRSWQFRAMFGLPLGRR